MAVILLRDLHGLSEMEYLMSGLSKPMLPVTKNGAGHLEEVEAMTAIPFSRLMTVAI